MTNKPTEDCKREAVRIAMMSGLPRKQMVADLGVGHSTLNKWAKAFGDAGTVPQGPNWSRKSNGFGVVCGS